MFSGVPLPKVVADTPVGGGILGSMQAGKNYDITAAQAKYAPQQAYANALLTTQQANYTPIQYQLQAYTSPMLWAAVANNPAAQQQLGNQLRSVLSQMPNSNGQNSNLPQAPNQSSGNSILDMILNPIRNKLFGQASQQNAMQSVPGSNIPASPNASTQQPNAQPNGSQQPIVNNNQYSGQQTPLPAATGQAAIPNSTIGRAATGSPLNGFNPATISQAQGAGLNATATNEAANQQAQWKDRQDSGSIQATAAQSNLNYLDELENNYSKLGWYEKGPYIGELPGMTGEANIIDSASKSMLSSVARANQDGHITNDNYQMFTGMKPGRQQTEEGFKNSIEFNKGMNERLLEVPAFNNAAQNAGLTPNQAQSVWTYYARTKPFYDGKTNKIIDDNLGEWEDYLTLDKIKEALSPKQQRLSAKAMAPTPSNNQTPGNNIPDVVVTASRPNSNSEQGGYDPTTILNYKFKSPQEFKEAFNALNDDAKKQVIAEMQKRGWH